MSKRYETIRFDDFSDGEQCDILKPTEKSFEVSNDVVIENNKIKLGPLIKGGALYDSGLRSFSSNRRQSFWYYIYVYILSSDLTDCFIKKLDMNSGGFTAVVTLPDSGDAAYCLIKFRGLVIASYKNNANTAYLLKHSTDGMTMAAWANTNLMALVGGVGTYIISYKVIHDRLFILCDNNSIYYSDDGITFVLLVELDSASNYGEIDYLSGYLYLTNVTDTSISGIVRVSLSGEIQDEVVSFGPINSLKIRVFVGHLYAIVNRKFLYRIEGSSLVLLFTFDAYSNFVYSPEIVEFLVMADVNDEIFSMSIDEKISRPYNALGDVVSFHRDLAGTIASIQIDSGNAQAVIYENAKFVSSGSIQTYIARLKGGLGTPVQLVLNHKPLTANAWVKVYIKFDNAAAWGAAVITSIDLNAVKDVYDFPVGTECSFIQAKIEYGTDDDAETPEDATLDLIYLPTGLVNAE